MAKKLHYWIHEDEARLMHKFDLEYGSTLGDFESWLQRYKKFWEDQGREFILIKD